MNAQSTKETRSPWRLKAHEIIFEADKPAGRTFDIALLVAILLSVAVVMLESVAAFRSKPAIDWLKGAEWFFTILFTIEYILRLMVVRKPMSYALSFYGVVDLLAILPTYLAAAVLLFGSESSAALESLVVIRALRLLRVFRILKLTRFLSEATAMRRALWASRAKIIVFLTAVLIVVAIMGSALYLIEGPSNGFHSIPMSMYWAIVTMTTVGYGDLVPQTILGKTTAAAIMILGYSFIIIPTGIVSAEIAKVTGKKITTITCPDCSSEGHDEDAIYCKFCGGKL